MTSHHAKMQDAAILRVMRTLRNSTDLSQLNRTERLGMSLRVWNYCLNALVGESLIKQALFQSRLRYFK